MIRNIQYPNRLPLLPVYFGIGAVFGSFIGSLAGLIVLSILVGAVIGVFVWGLDVLLSKVPLNKL